MKTFTIKNNTKENLFENVTVLHKHLDTEKKNKNLNKNACFNTNR